MCVCARACMKKKKRERGLDNVVPQKSDTIRLFRLRLTALVWVSSLVMTGHFEGSFHKYLQFPPICLYCNPLSVGL